jgi:hypothetical protein
MQVSNLEDLKRKREKNEYNLRLLVSEAGGKLSSSNINNYVVNFWGDFEL